jgi:hypothetical protein
LIALGESSGILSLPLIRERAMVQVDIGYFDDARFSLPTQARRRPSGAGQVPAVFANCLTQSDGFDIKLLGVFE